MRRGLLPIVLCLVLSIVGCTQRHESVGVQTPEGGKATGAAAPSTASSQAVDYSAYKIKYYPPSAPSSAAAQVKEDNTPFKIVDHGPTGNLPADVKKPSIYVLFSQPVVPLSMLGAPQSTSKVMSIDPPLSGVYRWYGTRLLSFDSSQETLPQRRYTVTIAASTTSLGGKALTGNNSFTFQTEPLSLRNVRAGTGNGYTQDDVPISQASTITMLFSYPVNLDVIKGFVTVQCDGKFYDFSARMANGTDKDVAADQRDRTVILSLSGQLPEDSDVHVTLGAGAKSEEDYIGTASAIDYVFHTIRPFKFVNSSSYSWSYPGSSAADANPVYLTFSHPVDPEDVPDKLTIIPPVSLGSAHATVQQNQIKIDNLPFKPESTFTVVIDKSLRDVYGRPLGATVRVKVKMPEARSYSYFPNTGTRMLESQFPHKIVYEFQNIFDGVWKVGRITDPYQSFSPTELEPFDFSGVPKNVRHFETLNLDPWLNEEGKGFVGVSWNFHALDKRGQRPDWAQKNLQLEVTDLGVTTRIGANRVLVLVTSLSSGNAVPDARVSLMNDENVMLQASTDETGLVSFDFAPGEYDRYFQDPKNPWQDHLRIRVEHGLDKVEFVPNGSHNPYRSGVYSVRSPLFAQKPRMETLIFTDRNVYRPGETVSFRGIDLNLVRGQYSAYSGPYSVEIRQSGYKGKVLDQLAGTTTDSGGWFGSYVLPANLSPGHYVIAYRRGGNEKQEYFQVANFTPVAFQVNIDKPDLTYYSGDTLRFHVDASYLAGGSVGGGNVEASWSKTPAHFRPPGDVWKDYSFGPSGYDQAYSLGVEKGKLAPDGTIDVAQKTTPEGTPGRPYTYQLEARVEDAAGQQIAKRASVLVHPASFYIGAELDHGVSTSWSSFVEKGQKVEVSLAAVLPSGGVYTGSSVNVGVKLYRVDWKVAQQQGVSGRVSSRYERVEELESESTTALSGGTGKVAVTPQKGGEYIVRLTAQDEQQRAVETDLDFFATGSEWVRWGGSNSDQIQLSADKKLYEPGETANILVRSPLPSGTYLITVEREGIFEETLVNLKGSTQVVGIPIRANYVPLVYVSVCSYSVRTNAQPKNSYFEPDLDKPKGYYGVVPVYVDTSSKRIDLKIDTGSLTYLPGGNAEVSLLATRGGKPVADAELAFLAVDRSVVDLTDYHIPNPLDYFYSPDKFPLEVEGADSRSLLIDPVTYEVRDLYGGDAGDEKGAGATRENFVPTAVFDPFLKTDENGRATVKFKLPDSLTTYRCTAVATKDATFGYAESELRVQQPINVRVSLPKQLRYRDTAEISVVLTNMDKTDHDATVSLSTDVVQVDGDTTKNVHIPSGQTVTVPFTLLATSTGRARLAVTTDSDVIHDSLVRYVDVELPSVTETVATIGQTRPQSEGSLDGSAAESVVIPSAASVQSGSLSILLSASRLSALKGSVDYVFSYPYGCFEQRTSRMLPLVLFGKYIGTFGLATRVPDVRKTVESELTYWSTQQLPDGGFPFWPEDAYRSSYYISGRVAHVLYFARQNGYAIPPKLDVNRLLHYLDAGDQRTDLSLYERIYGVYVRSLYGQQVLAQATRLLNQGNAIGISGYGMLGLTFLAEDKVQLADEALTALKNLIRPGTQTVDLSETFEGAQSGGLYGSQVEQLSLLLMLYERLDPQTEMLSRIVNTLIQRQHDGRWGNTSEIFWALQAFAQLLAHQVEAFPDYTAEAKIDDTSLLETRFTSPSERLAQSYSFDGPPLEALSRGTPHSLTFSKSGPGTLYYNVTLSYEIPSETATARDEGIGVYSEIEELDGTPVSGSVLQAGKTYRERIFISSPRHRSFLAVRAPVASGAEILDSFFVTTPTYPEASIPTASPTTTDYRFRPVQKIMKDEVRYFFNDFPQGRAEVSFLFRTINKGAYPTPPVQAVCMYEPEVFGRSAGSLIVIK